MKKFNFSFQLKNNKNINLYFVNKKMYEPVSKAHSADQSVNLSKNPTSPEDLPFFPLVPPWPSDPLGPLEALRN